MMFKFEQMPVSLTAFFVLIEEKITWWYFFSQRETIPKVGHLKQLLLSVFMLCLENELYRYLFLKVEESGGIRG